MGSARSGRRSQGSARARDEQQVRWGTSFLHLPRVPFPLAVHQLRAASRYRDSRLINGPACMRETRSAERWGPDAPVTCSRTIGPALRATQTRGEEQGVVPGNAPMHPLHRSGTLLPALRCYKDA